MMTRMQTFISRLKTPPSEEFIPRQFWCVTCIFFALAFLFSAYQWSRGQGDAGQLAGRAGILLLSAFWFSRGGWLRAAYGICSMALLVAALVSPLLRVPI